MKHHRALWFFIVDSITDFRAWLQSLYHDERQMIAIIEADARAALKRAKELKS